jgi:parallel beta-helix repeat protein
MKTRIQCITGMIAIIIVLSMACGNQLDLDTEERDGEENDNTYYVSTNGDDEAEGVAPKTAFKTISRAVWEAGPGSTIIVSPGIYNEEIILFEWGSADALISLRGEGDGVILDGERSHATGIWCEECENVVFENLEIRNYSDVGIGVYMSESIVFRNLTVHDNGFAVQLSDWDLEGYGIMVDETRTVIVEDSEVFRNGPEEKTANNPLGTEINVYASHGCLIRNNRSYENRGGGILVEDSVDIIVENNQVYANDLDASFDGWWDGGLWLDGGHNVTVRNNVFQDNLGPGIEISDEDIQNPSGYVLEGNLSTGNYYGIYIWNFGTGDFPDESILVLKDNQFTNNLWEDVLIDPWGCPPEDQPCD